MEDQKEKVLETLVSPDIVQEGDLDTLISAKYYPKTPVNEKFLAVVYKEVSKTEGFVLTAYFTNKPSERRKVLWTR